MKPQKKEGVKVVQDEGGNVLLTDGKQFFSVDPVILFVLDRCNGELTMEQIAGELAEATGLAIEMVQRVVEQIIEALANAGMIERT